MFAHLPTLLFADTTDAWSSSFLGLDPDHRFVLMIVAIVFGTLLVISTVGILSTLARSIHNRRLETELKRDLLDRGMTAEEVARVVEASAGWRGWGNRHAMRGDLQ